MPTQTRGVSSLTVQQRRVYDYIRDYIRDHNGQSPTLREVAEVMGFSSPNGVMCHMRALEKKGVIARDKHRARAIQVVVDEPIRARRRGPLIQLDCGDRVYDLDEAGAAKLGAALSQLAGPTP